MIDGTRKCLLPIVLVMLISIIVGCQSVPDPPASAFKTPESSEQTVKLTVYYPNMSGGFISGEAERFPNGKNNVLAKKTIESLIKGNVKNQHNPSAGSIFNQKTEVLDVNIKNGTATIDFNRSLLNVEIINEKQEDLAIAAIVNTLSQFPKVTNVIITVEGKMNGKVGDKRIEEFWGKGTLKHQPFEMKETNRELNIE